MHLAYKKKPPITQGSTEKQVKERRTEKRYVMNLKFYLPHFQIKKIIKEEQPLKKLMHTRNILYPKVTRQYYLKDFFSHLNDLANTFIQTFYVKVETDLAYCKNLCAKGLPTVTIGLLPERPALSKTKVFPRKLEKKKSLWSQLASSLLPKVRRWINELQNAFWDPVMRHIVVNNSRWLASLLSTIFSVDVHLKLADIKIW